jgi:hypothetical protein
VSVPEYITKAVQHIEADAKALGDSLNGWDTHSTNTTAPKCTVRRRTG